jgi:hypothetical protein
MNKLANRLSLLGFACTLGLAVSGCARKVVLDPSAAAARHDSSWTILKVPPPTPAAAAAPAAAPPAAAPPTAAPPVAASPIE